MEPMRCYQCGTPLSSIKEAFDMMKQIKLESSQGSADATHVGKRMVDSTQNVTLNDIFEILQLPKQRYCCRTHLETTINFHDMEKN
jgi:DNA-directed RNA polymerase subunit N (RpoN/RPB10)